jgi:hypothetical protein
MEVAGAQIDIEVLHAIFDPTDKRRFGVDLQTRETVFYLYS